MYVCVCVCVCTNGTKYCRCGFLRAPQDYLEIVTYFFLFLVLGNRHTPSRQFRAIYTAMSLYGSSRSSCLLFWSLFVESFLEHVHMNSTHL